MTGLLEAQAGLKLSLCLAEDELRLLILLPLPFSGVLALQVCVIRSDYAGLRIDHTASFMLGKHYQLSYPCLFLGFLWWWRRLFLVVCVCIIGIMSLSLRLVSRFPNGLSIPPPLRALHKNK